MERVTVDGARFIAGAMEKGRAALPVGVIC
jgi:hypothetical protein